MPAKPNQVFLYAAVEQDLWKALAAADVSGIPQENVLGNFSEAWHHVQNGNDLVIAVGGAALYALYYNPCGWPNPSGEAGGHTPFKMFPHGHGVDAPEADTFVNAAGKTAMSTLKLAVMLSYYAVHGTFPQLLHGLPQQETPQHRCLSHAQPNLTVPTVRSATTPNSSGGVGVYADFTSTAAVQHALQLGWPGIACTGALGIHESPYTKELTTCPDAVISEALNNTSGDVWWISYWTVSWPANGDAFYEGGYAAGRYAAETLTNLNGKYLPNYVVIDPEGYNTPAQTASEWMEWLHGWAEGITSVNSRLKPGFYCNQSQYVTYQLNTIDLPAFIAVSPIEGYRPTVSGNNIVGYAAYYAGCPAASYVAQVRSWGGKFNTVQFRDSGTDCGP
ncbi:MAG: hypothetical protein K6T83_15980 [Alicyclobacillus sp.]|nr:hypothetical protein [Alicyclobacillus sp.]